MSVFNLPGDIPGSSKQGLVNIIIHDYTAKPGSFKGRSILHTNAISLVIRGKKTMRFAEKTISISSNEFHFLSAGNCIASMNLSNKEGFRSILLFFDNKILADFSIKYDQIISRLKNKKNHTPEPYVSFPKDVFVHNYIASLTSLIESSSETSAEMKLVKFEELMLYLLEKHTHPILSFMAAQNTGRDVIIRKAVETNLTSNISLEELAFLCNMSLSTFKRQFTKIYGTSPNKWILQRRMEIARDLLTHFNEKPSSIYHKIGYENHSSFTKSFRLVYGVTPKDFQKQNLAVYQ